MTEDKRAEEAYLAVGRIIGPHGIRGEVKVEPLTDFPERFRAGAAMYLATQQGQASLVVIASARPHQKTMLVKFDAVADRDAAEELRGRLLLIPERDAMELGEHENYVHDLVGLRVETRGGDALGELTEVLATPANDVYVVTADGREILIPALRSVVLSVDLAARRMVVELPDGLAS